MRDFMLDKTNYSVILKFSKILVHFIEEMSRHQFNLMEAEKFKDASTVGVTPLNTESYRTGVINGLSEVNSILSDIADGAEHELKISDNKVTLQLKEAVKNFPESPYKDIDFVSPEADIFTLLMPVTDNIESLLILNYSKTLTYFIEKMKNYQTGLMENARREDKEYHKGVIAGLDEVLLILEEIIKSEDKKQKTIRGDLLFIIKDAVIGFHKSPYREEMERKAPLCLDSFRYPVEYKHFKKHFQEKF